MDCNYTTIKTCELKGSTFRSRVLDFGNFNISGYTFKAIFKNQFSQKISEIDLTALGNVVEVPFSSIENLSGNITVDVWMEDSGGFRDKVIEFDLRISTTGCPSDASIKEGVSVTFGGLKVPVVISQAIVNNYIDYDSLTPEQKTELRFDWEDFTPENIVELQQPAIEAAALANAATAAATIATTAANTATGAAITATENAIDATGDALTAAANANSAADFAVQATAEAVTATGDAIAATAAADSATDAADLAATNAQAKATLADTAAGNAQQTQPQIMQT